MQYTFSVDPEEVLGVRAGASLEEIRLAYREKARRYHPDAQGDPWAFRVVSKAYELLCAGRVAHRIAAEEAASRPSPPPAPSARPSPPPINPSAARSADGGEQVRSGVRDQTDDPARLVDVDLLLLRYAVEDPMEYFLLPAEERNLSCSLNLSWPSRRLGRPYPGPANPSPYLAELEKLAAAVGKKTRAEGVRSRSDSGRFTGWLTYPTAARASEAFNALRAALKEKGYGVDQRTRELIVPREEG